MILWWTVPHKETAEKHKHHKSYVLIINTNDEERQ